MMRKITGGARRLGIVLPSWRRLWCPRGAADAGSRPAFAEQARSAGLDQRQARLLQAGVDKVLAGLAGGRQISANEVESGDGRVKITVPVPGEERPRPLSRAGAFAVCDYGKLRLFDGPNYTGQRVLFDSDCGYLFDLKSVRLLTVRAG